MKPATKLRLADAEDPTRQMVEMARIEQSHREWSPQGWQPIDVVARNPLDVDAVVARSYRVLVVTDAVVPWWRRALRWLTGKVGRR